MAEIAVHFSWATLPSDYVMITIEIPDDLVAKVIAEEDLPEDWQQYPHPNDTKRIGDEFVIENRFCMMKIPSAVTKGDFNMLINPKHKGFDRIQVVGIEPFPFDRRLFK